MTSDYRRIRVPERDELLAGEARHRNTTPTPLLRLARQRPLDLHDGRRLIHDAGWYLQTTRHVQGAR